MQEQVQRMQDSLQQMVTAYQKAEAGLSPAARETRQRSIGDREQEYQTRTQALDLQAQQRQAQLLQPIIDQIKVALEDVRKEEGLTLVLDVGSQANPIVAIDKDRGDRQEPQHHRQGAGEAPFDADAAGGDADRSASGSSRRGTGSQAPDGPAGGPGRGAGWRGQAQGAAGQLTAPPAHPTPDGQVSQASPASLTAAQIAEATGGRLVGDGETVLSGIAPLDRAERDELSFLASLKYAPLLAATGAGAESSCRPTLRRCRAKCVRESWWRSRTRRCSR